MSESVVKPLAENIRTMPPALPGTRFSAPQPSGRHHRRATNFTAGTSGEYAIGGMGLVFEFL